MKYNDYKKLYDRLNRPEDIEIVKQETNIDGEMLLVFYTQKTVRNAIRNFYHVKNHSKKLLWQWQQGRTFINLANSWKHFPPILMALIILQERGITKKQFWRFVREPLKIGDKRLRREMEEIAEKDLIYSPKGMELQYARGRWGENKLREWLDSQNIEYRTEKELKRKYIKTPDCLLYKPLKIDDINIWWIESKASFGDMVEVRKNAKRQLIPYTNLFGEGMVVYWFGFVDDIKPPSGVKIVDNIFFEKRSCQGQGLTM